MTGPTDTHEPGWYDDPEGGHTYRMYWDGMKWTGDTRPHPRRAVKQAKVAGWVLGVIVLATFIGIALAGADNWLIGVVFLFSGAVAGIPVLVVFVWLLRRARRSKKKDRVPRTAIWLCPDCGWSSTNPSVCSECGSTRIADPADRATIEAKQKGLGCLIMGLGVASSLMALIGGWLAAGGSAPWTMFALFGAGVLLVWVGVRRYRRGRGPARNR